MCDIVQLERTKTVKNKFHLSDFFNSYWDVYKQSPNHYISPEQYKAVSAIRTCRTESLGIDHYICEECGELSYVYHSCKNRFCPKCSWQDTLKWADKLEGELLNIPHRHVVFTLPHRLNNLLKSNKRIMLNILFKSASEAIQSWIKYKYKLTPGIVNVLHTFGEKKNLHPHIHMLLSWGGIDENYVVHQIEGDYINYKFIQTKFRNLYEDKLLELFDKGLLDHNFADRISIMRFLRFINEKNWHLHFEPSNNLPSQVIRYIGRYSKRACLSEYKITNISGEYISFLYKDYKNLDIKGKPIIRELRFHYREFFPLLLQHVPLPYTRLVRYYGAYSPRTKSLILKADYLEEKELSYEEEPEYELPETPKICNVCNREKIYLYTVFKNNKGDKVYMTRYNPKKKHEKLKQEIA